MTKTEKIIDEFEEMVIFERDAKESKYVVPYMDALAFLRKILIKMEEDKDRALRRQKNKMAKQKEEALKKQKGDLKVIAKHKIREALFVAEKHNGTREDFEEKVLTIINSITNL